mgnify:CR=1 FL=1
MNLSKYFIPIIILTSCADRGLYKESQNKVARSANGVVSTSHPVSYTHMTLPTNKEVKITVVEVSLKK